MTQQVPFIPKPKPPMDKEGKPLIDQAKIEAMRKMRETTPKYLIRSIVPSQQRPGQYEMRGVFADSVDDIYLAILNSVAFDVYTVGSSDVDAESIPESEWRKLAEAWQEKSIRERELKMLSELKAKYEPITEPANELH